MVFLLYIIGTLILIFSLIMGFKSGTTLGVFIGLVGGISSAVTLLVILMCQLQNLALVWLLRF